MIIYLLLLLHLHQEQRIVFDCLPTGGFLLWGVEVMRS